MARKDSHLPTARSCPVLGQQVVDFLPMTEPMERSGRWSHPATLLRRSVGGSTRFDQRLTQGWLGSRTRVSSAIGTASTRSRERFIRELDTGLAAELELLRNEGVYVDYERLNGGHFIEANLARAIYESACMVMIYHPTYFDSEACVLRARIQGYVCA